MGLRLAAAGTGPVNARCSAPPVDCGSKLQCRANWVNPRVMCKVADELARRGGKTLELLYLGEKY